MHLPSLTSSFSSSGLALAALLSVLLAGQKGSQIQSGKAPSCDAGPNQVVECTAPITPVQLDGSGSSNPVQGELLFHWELCGNPRVTIDDPSSPTPILFVDMNGTCSQTCNVTLVVRNQYGPSICHVLVTVQDTTAPAIACPPDVTIDEGDPTDPTHTGTATATDAHNPTPTISYVDDLSQGPYTILRTWSADDGCLTSSCVQTITIQPSILEGHFDIRPGACPNLIEVDAGSFNAVFLPTSLLGNDFDVTQVDLNSLQLERSGFFMGGSVPPNETGFTDNGTPFLGQPCGCHTLGADGVLDLGVFFDLFDVVTVLGLDQEPNGTEVELQLSGLLLDGTPFIALDCVKIINH